MVPSLTQPNVDTQDLTHLSGSDNTPGIQQQVFYAVLEDIDMLPLPAQDDSASPTGTFADLVTITADIIMKAGKQFHSIYVTLEEGDLKHEGQGETDSMSYKNTLEFSHPGSKAEVLGFAQWVKNNNIVFLVPEVDGQVRLLGSRAYPAKLSAAPGGTGKKSTDGKKTTFTFHSSRKGPAPIFKGHVQLFSTTGGVTTGNQNLHLVD